MIEQHYLAMKNLHGRDAVLERELEMRRRRYGPPRSSRRRIRQRVGRALVGLGSKVMGEPTDIRRPKPAL